MAHRDRILSTPRQQGQFAAMKVQKSSNPVDFCPFKLRSHARDEWFDGFWAEVRDANNVLCEYLDIPHSVWRH